MIIEYYCIKATKKDEKEMINRVNEFLKTLMRSLSRQKNPSVSVNGVVYVLKHFYWNLNKDTQTYFEIFLNEDLEGKFFDVEHSEYGWMMKVIYHEDRPGFEMEGAKGFIEGVLKAMGFEYVGVDAGRFVEE
jgi:hypothetical protein